MSRRGWFFILMCAFVVAACGSETVVVDWDLREPMTAIELGSTVEAFVDVPGPAAATVTFPNGRVVTGEWSHGVRLGAAPGGDLPVQTAVFSERATDLDELETLIDAFQAEWGPASGSVGPLDDFLADLRRRAAAPTAEEPAWEDLEGRHELQDVFAFDATVVDGLEPSFSVRFSDRISVAWQVRFGRAYPDGVWPEDAWRPGD